MNLPLVSICIPNYNYDLYVGKAIQSAIDQSYDNVEVVVVDNASTDNSMEVISSFKENDKVKIFENSENIGALKNFNKSFELSKGDYIVFLSSDDMLRPDFVKKCMQVFEKYDVGMVGTEMALIDKDDNILDEEYIPFYDDNYIIPGIKQAKVFMMGNCFGANQVLIKKSVLEKVGLFDSRFEASSDWHLWFRICMQSDIAYLKEQLTTLRLHGNNRTLYHGRKSLEAIFIFYTMKLDFLSRIKGNSYLESFSKESITKLANNCIKFSVEMLTYKEHNVALQYLNMARVFDSQIENEHSFKTISYCINSGYKNPLELYKKLKEAIPTGVGKGKPYNAPEGSIKFNLTP